MLSQDKKYCESYGHGERLATHKRDSLRGQSHQVFMCYECYSMDENVIKKFELNVQELREPGHDD